MLSLTFILSFHITYGQKKLITGNAEYLITDSRLMKQYEFEVLQQAISNALYKAYGSSVISNYESLSEVTMSGYSVTSQSQSRSQYINTYPNGIWKEHKKEPVYSTYKDEKGNWWLRCEVIGYSEEMKNARVGFSALTLDGTEADKDQSTEFMTGEQGFIFFRSPISGYLLVFYDDFNTVQRCLPYNEMEDDFVTIASNTDYLFFSQSHSNITDKKIVDEIEFYTNASLEYNQFFVLFTPEKISLPLLNDETVTSDNYSSFKFLSRDDFHNWLQKCRLKNDKLQVEIIGITIKNPKVK